MGESEAGFWSRVNLASLLVGGVITSVLALVGTFVYERATALDERLEYEVSRTPPLIGELENALLYTVRVRNAGEREVEAVRIGVSLGNGSMEAHEIEAPPALDLDENSSTGGDGLLIEIPELNPDDAVQVALLARYPPGPIEEPEIDVRGDGVTGTVPDKDDDELSWSYVILNVVAPLTAVFVYFLYSRLWQVERRRKYRRRRR